MTPAELLDKAACVIDKNGFAPGEYIEYDSQQSGRPLTTCPVCPRAAIAIAADRHPLFVVGWPNYCESFPSDDGDRAALAEIQGAEAAFARYLREELDYTDSDGDDYILIERWADEDGRTETQVVDALRAAARTA